MGSIPGDQESHVRRLSTPPKNVLCVTFSLQPPPWTDEVVNVQSIRRGEDTRSLRRRGWYLANWSSVIRERTAHAAPPTTPAATTYTRVFASAGGSANGVSRVRCETLGFSSALVSETGTFGSVGAMFSLVGSDSTGTITDSLGGLNSSASGFN